MGAISTNRTELLKTHFAYLQELHDGDLTPEIVVEDARRADSPIHDEFDWDVDRAAYAHWIDHARELIRYVRVVVWTDPVIAAVVYMQNPDLPAHSPGYVTVQELAEDPDRSLRAIRNELDRIDQAVMRALQQATALGLRQVVTTYIAEMGARYISPPPPPAPPAPPTPPGRRPKR